MLVKKSTYGDCFVALPANCVSGSLIIGRNVEDATAVGIGVSTEICYYDVSNVLEGKTDGGAAVESEKAALRIILQKPRPGLWGGDFGSNERGVAVGLTWTEGEQEAKGCDTLLGTDIVRITLAECDEAESAVDRIGALVAKVGHDELKLNFIVCDSKGAWVLSSSKKFWAAEKIQASCVRVPLGGLTVRTTIDKSSEGVDTSVSFAAAMEAEAPASQPGWVGPEPSGDGSFTQRHMFETLREACGRCSRAAIVSVLSPKGGSISCHWFTGTPNAAESVFKPFVFAPNPKISPLTQVQPEAKDTLLHILHGNRKPAALEHLRSLEDSCVDELNNYFSLQDHASEELDELLKDCVEAEVKFYR